MSTQNKPRTSPAVTMTVHYISDVHVDAWCPAWRIGAVSETCAVWGLTGGDVLILAGDLGNDDAINISFLDHVSGLYGHVLLVIGNHDRYSSGSSDTKSRVELLRKVCMITDNLVLLEGGFADINGFRFAGCGMSWDCSYGAGVRARKIASGEHLKPFDEYEARTLFRRTLNDALYILADDCTPMDPFELFRTELRALRGIADTCTETPVDVMITHYGPSVSPNMRPDYADSEISTFFYFDGSEYIKSISPKVWVYGHTHDAAEYAVHDTRMLVNPVGYRGENTNPGVKTFTLHRADAVDA